MELKVEIEISISDSTKAFIASLIGAPIRVASIPTEEVKPAITAVAAPEEKPAEAKKPARKTKKEEPVETPAEPEPEKPAEPEKPEEKPAAVDYDQYRKELRAFCSQRRVEGVNISGLVGQFLDKRGAKFSEIPDEKLEAFRKLVEAAEVQ